MVWSKELDKNINKKKFVRQEEEKTESAAPRENPWSEAVTKNNNPRVRFEPKKTESSTASKKDYSMPSALSAQQDTKFKGFTSYDERKKNGRVFTPSTVLGERTQPINYDKSNMSEIIPNVTIDLEKNLSKLITDYEQIVTSNQTSSEKMQSVNQLIKDNGNIFNEYSRQTGGNLTVPGLDNMYQKYVDNIIKQMGKDKQQEQYRSATLKDLTVNSFKRGFYNSHYGKELYKKISENKNYADFYGKELENEKYKFEPKGLIQKAISGASQQLGQQLVQATDPTTIGMMGSALGMSAAAGNAGPQALVPEEIITGPAAVGFGYAAGSALSNMKIESGLAYDEMVKNGIAEDTATKIALGVGGVNAALEVLQADDLIKSFKILSGSKATKNIAEQIGEYIVKRGGHIASETAQEVAQEGVTTAGVQFANKHDKGEWAYSADEVKDRLKDTATSSALTFAAMGGAGDIAHIGMNTVGKTVDNYNQTVNTGRAFKDMGEAESVINTGIKSDTDTSAYKYAQKLQKKQAEGKGLSNWNVGRQYMKNITAIQSENDFAAAMSKIRPTEIVDKLYTKGGQELNGMATGEEVKVSADGDTSVNTSIKHEWSHMFRNLDPNAYQEYEDSVIAAARETDNDAVDRRIKYLTEEYGYSKEMAQEEIVAELTGGFNTKAIQQMAEGNATLAEKIATAASRAKARIKTAFGGGKYTSTTGVSAAFSKLNQAEKMYIDGLAAARDRMVNTNEVRYSPIETNSKGKYVQADRQVITSDNSADWEGEIYNYINDKIRNGQDVIIPTMDGDNLTISEKTAWKMGYRNRVLENGTERPYNNNEYRTKLNAAAHIDELAEISKRGKKNVSDTKNHDFAQDGFNYRTAYFRDLDGQYYRLIISVGENSEHKTIYNIGRIEKTLFPDSGSKTNSIEAVHGEQSPSTDSISEKDTDVKYSVKENAAESSLIDEYNAESASRADSKKFDRHDVIPAIKNYGIGFMAREVDKLYPIKSYERFAQNQIRGKEKIQFEGKDSPYVMSTNSIDAQSRAKYILTEKLTDFDANEIGESLADIVGELDYNDYRDFNTYLKLKHGVEWVVNSENDYKPVFSSKILNSPEAMQAGIKELEVKHADFAELSERIYKYQADLMQAWLVDTGVITQKQFDTLREKYPCYVPFFRMDDTAPPRFTPKKGIANQSNPIMQAEGGGQKIYDPIENIMINTARFVNAAAKNSAMQAVVNIYDNVPGMEHYMAEAVKNADGKYILKDKNHQSSSDTDTDTNTEEYISDMVQHAIKLTDGDIVTVLENGKKRYFKVFDRNLLNALDNMRPMQSNAVMRAVASATRVFSALATNNNPVFTLASNPIKDTQNAFMQTTQKNPFAVVTAILDAQAEQFKNSDMGKRIGKKHDADYDGTDAYKKYMAMGGEYASAFSAGRSAMKEALGDIKPKKGGAAEKAKGAVKFIPRLYGSAADAIETAPRLGEFKYSSDKAGNDVHQAHFDSKNVTLNFGRSGYVGEKINKFVPFYNPSVQGIATMVQKFKDNPLQTSMRVGVGIAISVLASAFNKRNKDSEEAYERASSYLKNNYYLFHIRDGHFIKIPKSQEYGIIPSLVERVIEKYSYDNPDAFYNYADYLSTALLPSIFKTEFPFIDTGAVIGLGTYTSLLENKDFKGSPIVPDYLADEVPEMQYDDRTSYIAKWIGKELKWSPKKIDYVIKSNTGFLGKINESIGHSGEKDWTLGVGGKFTADSLFSTDKPNIFYENKDKADRQAKSYPSADNEYLSKRFAQSGKVMSMLNAMYKEDSKSSRGREIRKAYAEYANANKDNPTGYSDEVYNNIKHLFETDKTVLSLPTVDRTIKAKIGKEDRSYTFNDADTFLQYQKDLNKNVDEAYRKLLSDISYNGMSNSEKVSALDKAKKKAVKEVKSFYIENSAQKTMYSEDVKTDIAYPGEDAVEQYTERQRSAKSKLQSVADNLAAAMPDKAADYSAKSLQVFDDISSAKIDGKNYDIPAEVQRKIIEAAEEVHYSNIERMINNEVNVEEVIGYTSKGRVHTSSQADGTKVALSGKLYNDDGSPRFDELVTAKIMRKAKEKAKSSAIEKYKAEITGVKTETSSAREEGSVKVSFVPRASSASGRRKSSSGGGRKRSMRSSGVSDKIFTEAAASVAARQNNGGRASLPDTIKDRVRFKGNAVKSAKLPNTVKFIPNTLSM